MNNILTRRHFIRTIGTGMLSTFLSSTMFARKDRVRGGAKPNVVIIIVDDLGYGEVSCYPQQELIRTPNIDRLAESGIRMTDGYAADGMCWPSRGSILTGRYHQRWGSRAAVPHSERMIPEFLRKAGFVSGCVGKWHNTGSIGEWDGAPKNHPFGWEFDEFFGFLGGMHDYFEPDLGTHFKQGRNRPHYMPIYNGVERVPKVKYLTEEFTDRAVDFINRHHARPFFLYLSYNAKHTPLQAPKKHLISNKNNINAAMIDAMDEGIGKVLNTLQKHGIYRNTLVFFMGDNGGWPAPNWKLRGKKSRFFEGGIRVPFIISWPKGLPQNKTYSAPVMHIDVLPTIMAAAGIHIPKDNTLDGKNLLPYLRCSIQKPPHDVLCWGRTNRTRFAVRRGDWKLVKESDNNKAEPKLGLYNLSKDLQEQDDLLKKEEKIGEEMMSLYEGWSKKVTRHTSIGNAGSTKRKSEK